MPDMQPHLAKFLENNEFPPEGTLKEVKELLSKPLQELENKEAEIERLKQNLKDLEGERNALQKSIDEYAPILSPIRRIPSDIIHEIFYRCLPTHRNPIMSITEAPLLLTRICQSWRSIALSSHRVWSKLHIPLLPCSIGNYSPYPHSPGVDINGVWERQRESVEKYSRTMRARCKLADIWLSRSGSCPLSISLNFLGGMDCRQDELDDGNALVQLLNTVISFSQRFSDLELSMPYDVYQILETRMSLDMVPRLRKLKVNFFEPVTPHPDMSKRSVIFLQAPKLQSISLYTDNIAVFDSRSIPSTWENLTNLAFNSAINSAEAVQVLQRCQGLVHCKLVISDGLDVYISPEDVLSLPRLRSLSIHVGGMDLMALLYRRIHAPILNSFDYQKFNRFPFSNAGYGNVSTPPSPVLSLLERYSSIKKLSFDSRILSAQDILFTFRFANQLTHLTLGPRPRNGSLYGDFGHYMGPGNFSLDLLTIGEDSSSDATASEREILLPNLEVFEAYVPASTFSDESLQRFILGRLGDPARKEVTALKTVKVNFDRTVGQDIKEEIYRRANETGVEITLDLRYVTETGPRVNSKYIDIFSPWYGLTESDRSWNFADVETEA